MINPTALSFQILLGGTMSMSMTFFSKGRSVCYRDVKCIGPMLFISLPLLLQIRAGQHMSVRLIMFDPHVGVMLTNCIIFDKVCLPGAVLQVRTSTEPKWDQTL